VVIFRATSPRFATAYEMLRDDRPNVTWVEECAFRDDLLASLGPEPLVVFHTDDDVFFDGVEPFELRDDEVCFTLRLGLNTTYCYPLDVDERLEAPTIERERVSWSWRDQAPGAYSYPLALNGHVFRSAEARDWLDRAAYANPNELEAALQQFNDEARPRMASFTHSRVLSIPANIVNETFNNRHGGLHEPGELNDRFLAGDRVDVGAMDFSAVTACHQEIALAFSAAAHEPI